MIASHSKVLLMAAMVAAGLGLVATPVVFELPVPSPAAFSSGMLGALMVLVGIGFGFDSLEWWSRFALGIGTWTLVAPMFFRFYEGGPAFLTHMAAGLVSLLSGVAGHELIIRGQRVSDRRQVS